MFLSARSVERGTRFESDVCVIGAGAAGIVLARALAAAGLHVDLVESGGKEGDPATTALMNGHVSGSPRPYPLMGSRLRFFGGSTNHWGGSCNELDAADFTRRAWIPESGWPIAHGDVAPWYPEAWRILDVGRRWEFGELEADTAAYPRLFGPSSREFEPHLLVRSPPTRIGAKYEGEIAASERVRCVLHANAVELVASHEGTRIDRVAARTLEGTPVELVAHRYVLAAGGIENARLLLLSDAVVPGGLGNRHDLVGRCFADHLNTYVGQMMVLPAPGARGFQEAWVRSRLDAARLPDVPRVNTGFRATDALRERHGLLACGILVYGPPEPAASGGAAPEASATDAGVAEVLAEARGDAPAAAPPPAAKYAMIVVAEQAPDRENRVMLSDERDALGQRKVAIRWRATETDVRSVRETLRLFATALAAAGRGRVQLTDVGDRWMGAGGHHAGTTRMADDPTRGVTDRHGRVHGVANLFVAGSSVFPTMGHAHPTLTIVAMALRLADHLRATAREAR